MAESKKSFVLYCDLIHSIETLTDSEAGILFKHILKYVNDLNPEYPDRITQIAFEPIKQQLKRDLKQWAETKTIRSEIGRLGGLKSAEAKRTKSNQIQPIASKFNQNQANQPVNVNVSVNDIYRELNESEIWLDQASHVIQSKSQANTKRLLKNWFTEKQATNELNGKSIDEIKRYFINSIKKMPLFEINKGLGTQIQGTF